MANKLYHYCRNFGIFRNITEDRNVLKRAIQIKAIEYGSDNGCVEEACQRETIDKVVNLFLERSAAA